MSTNFISHYIVLKFLKLTSSYESRGLCTMYMLFFLPKRIFRCPVPSHLLGLRLDVTSFKKMSLTTESKIIPNVPLFSFTALVSLCNYISVHQLICCLPPPVYCELYDRGLPCLFHVSPLGFSTCES